MGVIELLLADDRIHSMQIGKLSNNDIELLIVYTGESKRKMWYRCIYSMEMICTKKGIKKIFDLIIENIYASELILLRGDGKNVH